MIVRWFLSLCFLASWLAATAQEAAAVRRPTLFIIGDSTVKNGTKGQKGWGEVVSPLFDTNRLRISNHAIGGRSSRTFLTEGRWEKVLGELKSGDFVLMQFGHNDSGPLNDTNRARGSIKGIGEESQEIDNLLTKKHETVHSYGWYLRKYITEAKAKGATPIVCSPVPRNIWKDGKVSRSKDYAKWSMQVAQAEKVPFIHLHEIVAQRYEALGADEVAHLFEGDHTHTNPKGAQLNAECVVAGLKALPSCALCEFFSEKAAGVTKAQVPAAE